MQASVVVALGLQRTGSIVVVHGLSHPVACGIFPDQGLNPCPCIGRQILYHEPPGKQAHKWYPFINFSFDCSLLVYRNSIDFCISCNLTKHTYYFKWIPLQVFYVDDHVNFKKRQFYFLIINLGAFNLFFLCYCTAWNF